MFPDNVRRCSRSVVVKLDKLIILSVLIVQAQPFISCGVPVVFVMGSKWLCAANIPCMQLSTETGTHIYHLHLNSNKAAAFYAVADPFAASFKRAIACNEVSELTLG